MRIGQLQNPIPGDVLTFEFGDALAIDTPIIEVHGDNILVYTDEIAGKLLNTLEAEEHTYTVVHAKHGKEEIKASSSYGAAKKYAEMKKLKGTSGVDAHLHTKEEPAE
jgi:hypothetical protein